MIRLSLIFALFIGSALCAEQVNTFYGAIEIEEPVLLELIHSPAFQRLKSVHQYGVAYYTTHPEEYNRLDHSLGVFIILRIKGASLKEQIAGLLHDVSHTVFSHVGDWVFGEEYQENDYQSTIHKLYLAASGIEVILNKHGYTVEDILPKKAEFVMLEQPLPNLSADRIDYNMQGAYFQHFLTKEEIQELFQDLQFVDGSWLLTNKNLAVKLTRFSLFMTQDCWGSAVNYVTSCWLADAIVQGIKIGLISWHEFHFGSDAMVWNKLRLSQDPLIASKMHMLAHPNDYYHFTDPAEADVCVKFRCRGIDPWVIHEDKLSRLTWLDSELADALHTLQKKAANGLAIKLTSRKMLGIATEAKAPAVDVSSATQY